MDAAVKHIVILLENCERLRRAACLSGRALIEGMFDLAWWRGKDEKLIKSHVVLRIRATWEHGVQ